MMTVVRAILSVFSLARRFSMILALSVTAVLCVPSVAQQTFGTVLSHNGSTTSSPAGSGAANVELHYGGTTYGPFRDIFQENATHGVHFSYAPGPATSSWARSWITNETLVAWSGFEILLQGADFAGWNANDPVSAIDTAPVVDVGHSEQDLLSLPSNQLALYHPPANVFSLSDSSIARFNDSGNGFTDSLLTVTLVSPISPGDGMVLYFSIIPSPGAAGSPEFTAFFTPIPVPEPATVALLSLVVIARSVLRRRRGQTGVVAGGRWLL